VIVYTTRVILFYIAEFRLGIDSSYLCNSVAFLLMVYVLVSISHFTPCSVLNRELRYLSDPFISIILQNIFPPYF